MIYVSLKRSNYYVRNTWDRVSCSNHSKFHWAPINTDELTVIEVDIVPRHGERRVCEGKTASRAISALTNQYARLKFQPPDLT